MIPQSARSAYQSQVARAELLVNDLRQLFMQVPSEWYFTVRIKQADSFYQKIESGRFPDPEHLEDFVGAMVVVPTLPDIDKALMFIDGFFTEEDRRPGNSKQTTKSASDFRFDDLRLYGHLTVRDDLPPRAIDEVRFEIQVKTFLQHAWSIATHDLVYKFDSANWARSRVAHQIKALLEHADLSVSAIDSLQSSSHLPSSGQPESDLQVVIDLLSTQWTRDVLTDNRRRQAENLWKVAKDLGLSTATLSSLVLNGRRQSGGSHPDGYSPYQCLITYASLLQKQKLISLLTRRSLKYHVYITQDVLDRLGKPLSELPNARQ